MKHKEFVIPGITGVVSFALGIGGGWLLKSYFSSEHVSEEVEKKVENLDEEMTQLHFEFEAAKEHVSSMAGSMAAALKELKYEGRSLIDKVAADMHRANAMANHPANGGSENVATVSTNSKEDHWDYDEEEKTRSEDHPYILHVDEYFANEKNYTQVTLMYYEGDNILCDDQDVPLYNPETMVGKIRFGHGSNDPNVVYVRNDKLQLECEILNNPGHFQIEVLGAHVEENYEDGDMKHSARKFREV